MNNTNEKPDVRIVFFGSFLDFSAQVLAKISAVSNWKIVTVVTTPPYAAGKNNQLTPAPVASLADQLELKTFTPNQLDDQTLQELLTLADGPVDYFLVAGYGKKLPPNWLSAPKLSALNLHFSLLPKYRGANPAEWALIAGETSTGVTLIEMANEIDAGKLIAAQALKINNDDTRLSLYHQLYDLAGDLAVQAIPHYHQWQQTQISPSPDLNLDSAAISEIKYWLPPEPQPQVSPTPYAARLYRNDGFVAWSCLKTLMTGQTVKAQKTKISPQILAWFKTTSLEITPQFMSRLVRALAGYPEVWTLVNTNKGEARMKIKAATVNRDGKLELTQVQLAGQQPATYSEIKTALKN